MEKLEIDLNRIIRSRIGGWKGVFYPAFLYQPSNVWFIRKN